MGLYETVTVSDAEVKYRNVQTCVDLHFNSIIMAWIFTSVDGDKLGMFSIILLVHIKIV